MRGRFITVLSILAILSGCAVSQKVCYPVDDITPVINSSFIDNDLIVVEFENLRELPAGLKTQTAKACGELVISAHQR